MGRSKLDMSLGWRKVVLAKGGVGDPPAAHVIAWLSQAQVCMDGYHPRVIH